MNKMMKIIKTHKGLGFQKDDNEQVSTPYMSYNEQNDEDNKNSQGVKFLRGKCCVRMCRRFCRAKA
jgi:hypothetical protein